jgi:hypothetical protein
MEECYISLHHLFTDFQAAYKTIQERNWKLLRKSLNSLENVQEWCNLQLKTEYVLQGIQLNLSAWFDTTNGFMQGIV